MNGTAARNDLVEQLCDGVLDIGSGLTEATIADVRERIADVRDTPIVADATQQALVYVDRAVLLWLPTVLEACGTPQDMVAELAIADGVQDAESAKAACARVVSAYKRVDSEPEKAAAHHARQAAQALAADLERGTDEATATAAFNAGRVLGELIVAGERDLAERFLREAVAEVADEETTL